jgi:hypothetical protein
VRGRDRRIADRRAARVARTLALRAAGLPRGAAALSLAHSAGGGAAAVAPRVRPVGVDLIPLARVGERHARAILDAEEYALLFGRRPAVAPALAWALKEATAKATGVQSSCFPLGVRVRGCSEPGGMAPDVAVVEVSGASGGVFLAGWVVENDFLCAWAVRDDAERIRASGAPHPDGCQPWGPHARTI